MITTIKPETPQPLIDSLTHWLGTLGLKTYLSQEDDRWIIGIVGDIDVTIADALGKLDFVESVKQISEPFQLCSRDFQAKDTCISIADGKVLLGGGHFCLIAGPCSVETHEQIIAVAKAVKDAGAQILRGGAFKPRTSPYDFQGLGALGIEMLTEAKKETGLPVITEVMNINQLPLFDAVDIVQIGARNMQNFDLLKEVGRLKKPVLLKRGLCATIEEWLMSAEYIMAEGNESVILCERGIRTYETYTRNTLDLSAVPMLKHLSHLPVVVDPSHATGQARLVGPMALAATACGADGIMIEVHNDPCHALCDGAQSLTPSEFSKVAEQIRQVRSVIVP